MLRLAWIILAVSAVHAGKIPQKPTEMTINCSGRPDGHYVIGCNTNFTMCKDNIPYHYNCPAKLYYHAVLDQCDYKGEIKECKNAKAYEGRIIKTPSDFSCKNLADGSYSHPEVPCSRGYYICVHGNVVKQACPPQQFFDADHNRCEYQNRVAACKNKKISGVLTGPEVSYGVMTHQLPLDAAPPAPPTVSPIQATEVPFTKEESRPNCVTAGDGVYPDPVEDCADFFWKCAHEELFKYKCQKGLFYDIEANRCDHKEFVPNCGGVRQITTPGPVFDPSSIDFDCSGKENGYHVKEECTNVFYHCNEGIPSELKCDAGLHYDIRINACEYPEACRGPRTTAEPPVPGSHGNVVLNDDAKATEAPIDFDCNQKKDGIYALDKCQPNYVLCSSGEVRSMKCPSDLVFNENLAQCDFLSSCRSPSVATTSAPEEIIPYETTAESASTAGSTVVVDEVSTYSYSTDAETSTPTTTTRTTTTAAPRTTTVFKGPYSFDNTVTEGPADLPPAGEISCKDLANGAHAILPCSQEYVSCWDGITHKLKCPNSLYFNTYQGACDYKVNIPDCNPDGKARPIFTTTTTAVPAADIVKTTVVTPVAHPIDDFCKGKANGFYGKGCNDFFYSCTNDISYKFACPIGLFYDNELKQCERKETIVACGAKPKETTTTTTTAAPTPAADVTKPVAPVENFCEDKPNGFFGTGCNTFLYSCSNGATFKLPCPGELFFDSDKKRCSRKENIAACGATTTTTTTTTTTAAPETAVTVSEEKSNFCVGKENGFFGDACNQFFYSCQDGITHKLPCPGGLFFDEPKNRCNQKEEIVACGAAPVTIPAPVAPVSTVAADVAGNTPATPTEPFCERLANGFYGYGCSSFFYSCLNGETYKMDCPTGLVYDKETNRCDLKDQIKDCGAKPTEKPIPQVLPIRPTTAAPVPRPAYSFVTLAADVKKPVIFDCSQKKDGLYAIPECTPIFIQCYNSQTIQQECQTGLFYNVANGMCDYAENVVLCKPSVAATVATVSTTVTTITATSAPVTVPPRPELDAPAISSNASCTGKADGFYSNGCSATYFACIGEVMTVVRCGDPNLRYDAGNQRCDYPLAVQECGGSPATTPVEPRPTPAAASGVANAVPTQKTTFSCVGKTDGFYAISSCSKFYARCFSNSPYVQQCPGDLAFNPKVNLCDYKENIAACPQAQPTAPAVQPTVPTPAPSVAATTQAAPPAPPTAPVQPPQNDQSNFCSGKPNGIFPASECSSEFVICTDGIPSRGQCDPTLVFNGAQSYCDFPVRVAGCAVAPSQPAPVAPVAPVAQAAPASPYGAAMQQQQPQMNFSCVGRGNGLYGATCASGYWRCMEQRKYTYKCPTGQVYDGNKGQCEFRGNVVGC